MGGLVASIGSIGASGLGGMQQNKSQLQAAQTQAEIERMSRDFSRRQFQKQIDRQQPFVDVGTQSLPALIESISNRGDVSTLPATQTQGALISGFLGENAPGAITENALANLEAIEAEKNKGRLQNLVDVGLGGTGQTIGSRLNLGSTLGQSLASEGNILSNALQQSATNRQNIANQMGSQIGGLPALIATMRGGQQSQQQLNQPMVLGRI